MKTFGDFQNAAVRMQPGVITQEGFIGQDSRSLMDIIQADEEAFRTLGLEWEAVAGRLQYFRDAAEAGLGEPVTVDLHWIVQNFEARGKLPCPFGDCLLGKITTRLSSKKNDITILFSDLSLHLLLTHHFLQGRGAPFRLDPVMLSKIL